MLVEVKVKVARVIDGKTRKRTETLLLNRELFAEAEYDVMAKLAQEQTDGSVEDFSIQSLRMSPLKEVANQFTGDSTFIATLKNVWLADDGTEKSLKYKVLIWANDLSEAHVNTQKLARQGYDMTIEGITQVDYEYLDDVVQP